MTWLKWLGGILVLVAGGLASLFLFRKGATIDARTASDLLGQSADRAKVHNAEATAATDKAIANAAADEIEEREASGDETKRSFAARVDGAVQRDDLDELARLDRED